MKVKMICVLVAGIVLVGCAQPEKKVVVANKNKTAEAICNAKGGMPGGWAKSEVTTEAEMAVDLVVKDMDNSAMLKEVLAVYSQVVNGMNYALEFQLEDGTIWSAIVYRNLEGKYSITQTPFTGLFCDY